MAEFTHCSHCGTPTTTRIPEGDHLPRQVCDACGIVHYQNPRIVVGCVPEHDGKILICRRAIEPRHGYWTIPAGFLENGETLEQGAARECLEEAMAEVEIGSLLALVNITESHQVHVFFRAALPRPVHGAGPESLETALVDPADIPWDEIAFSSTRFALERYLADRAAGVENHHLTELTRRVAK
jgi:ADP-ribose pyrophosphatase YjhB (NUDIX family)